MKTAMTLTFASSLTDFTQVNSSFDSAVLRIAYPGLNRNHSFISKETFEKAMKTIYNCPVVAHYDRETDSFGGHDIEVVSGADGELYLANLTTPVGVIPESARTWWAEVAEEDGTTHEYLHTEVLLWKRQEAYRKLKRDGVTAHSMEITVLNGEQVDNVFKIYDFEFTAFALIGVEPCFESSGMALFSAKEFVTEYQKMMQELKEYAAKVDTPDGDDDTHPENLTEGGETGLEEKFEAMEAEQQTETEITETPEAEQSEDAFALTSNLTEEVCRALSAETVGREWGEMSRYYYVDCDFELNEVYCWDCEDWLLYGFTYTVSGDSVTVDFESRKRMKYAIVEFDEGEQGSPFAQAFAQISEQYHEIDQWNAEHAADAERIDEMSRELEELRGFQREVQQERENAAREAVFAQFADLDGSADFDALREHASEYDVDTLTEKCYALRGRLHIPAAFALNEQKTPKIKIDSSDLEDDVSDDPYGGIVEKYRKKK